MAKSPVDPADIQLPEGSEIHYGAEVCKQKITELLEQHHFPAGLLPVDVEEFRINRETGFFSMKQKTSKEHMFRTIGKLVSFAPVVTAVIEDHRMKKITGVKGKEIFIWISVCDMYFNNPDSPNITFMSSLGISKTFPVSAFIPENANLGH